MIKKFNIFIDIEYLGMQLLFISLLFINLLSRITGFNMNVLLYAVMLFQFIYSLKYFTLNKVILTHLLVVSWFVLYIFDFRYHFFANILTIKDIILPTLSIFIGFRLYEKREKVINFLNFIYLPFILYGIIQAVSYYTNNFARFLPWDEYWITVSPAQNLFQGKLLRFFGTMNSFVEYQVYVIFIIALIWLNYKLVKNKMLFKLNIIFASTFLAISLERSPIVMTLIFLFIWKLGNVFQKPVNILKYISILLIVLLAITANADSLRNNQMTASAFNRLENVLTMNFSKDASITERINGQWKESIDLMLTTENFFGIGTGKVTPSANGYKDYIGPHNNYFAIYLAYGFVGLLLFLILLLNIAINLKKLDREFKYFGYGILLSFCAMAVFNFPFSGRQSTLFFLIIGFLLKSYKGKNQLNFNNDSALPYKTAKVH
jgi:O-antigen ligase